MKRAVMAMVCATFVLFPYSLTNAQPRAAVAEEMGDHPRIATAVRDLEDAIAYMEAAPHNFGGTQSGSHSCGTQGGYAA